MTSTFFVPVAASKAGTLALRTGRLRSGERVGLAFTSEASLLLALGPAQQWIHLGGYALRDMLAPLGVEQVRVDPRPVGQPGAGAIPSQARRRPAPHPYTPVTPAPMAAWAMAFRSLSGHHWQRSSPRSVRGHHRQPEGAGRSAVA